MLPAKPQKQRKALRYAAKLKRDVTKQRTIMAMLGIACAIGIVAYFASLFAGLIDSSPLEQVICIVIAIFVGLFSVKATQSNRRYESYLRESGLTTEEVKSFMKEQ